MFSIIRESLKFTNLPSKRLNKVFAGLLFLALFLFREFPLGEAKIKALDKLLQLELGQLVTVLQELYVRKQLFSLISSANIVYYVSDFVFKFVILMVFILFLSLQVATYRKSENKLIIRRFITKQPVIWLFFFLLLVAVVAFASVLSPLPIVAISICLFLITQALFVPVLMLDYNYSLLQAFFISKQLMQGFKLNFLVNFMLCHFLFSFMPEFILSYLLEAGILFNLAMAFVKTIYALICLRCLFIYYFYLSEYYYPQIRALGLFDLKGFFTKLNHGIYPMYTDKEKEAMLARLQAEYGFEQSIEEILFNKDIKTFNKEVLQTELPLKQPLDKLLNVQGNKTEECAEANTKVQLKNTPTAKMSEEKVEPKQSIAEKQALLKKNLELIQVKLKTILAEAGLQISKDIYLEQAADSIASDFYRSERKANDLDRLVKKTVDYLKRCGRTLPLDEHKEGMN